jgi:hypothetical protein
MRLPIALALVAVLSGPALAADSDGTEPDPVLTPGAVETQDLDIICHHSTKERRHATSAEKRAVYTAYHLASRHDGYCATGGGCVLDDRVPIECGGENSPANLSPQVKVGAYNQAMKNRLEGLCHRLVCAGKITPAEGQAWFLGDWKAEYDRRFGAIVGK